MQTQFVTDTRNEQSSLIERIHEFKQTLAQPPAAAESSLWSALQTNRADHLPPELRERLFEELGLNWTSSAEFILVSKQTVRDVKMHAIRDDKLTDMVATVLAMTPEERRQVEAAMQRVRVDYTEWAVAHVERSEPKDDVVAQYILPGDPAMSQTISNNFATDLLDALGRERAELILPSGPNWMLSDIGICAKPLTMIVKRTLDANGERLKFQWLGPFGKLDQRGVEPLKRFFDNAFRPIFPNGWADIAKREGFELPEEFQAK